MNKAVRVDVDKKHCLWIKVIATTQTGRIFRITKEYLYDLKTLPV